MTQTTFLENTPKKSPENPQITTSQGQKKLTLYVYAELVENKFAKKIVRVNQVTKWYTPSEKSYQNAWDKALEAAIEIACNHLYELQGNRTPFNRVFISTFENIEAAKKDKNSISCTLLKG